MAAIYQWFTGKEIVVTTTLYPIEIVEGMNFGVALTYGDMWPINQDETTASWDFLSGNMAQILHELPVEEDETEATWDFLAGNLIQILNELPVEADETEATWDFIEGFMEQLLVETWIEDSGMLIGIAVKPSLCSMTPV